MFNELSYGKRSSFDGRKKLKHQDRLCSYVTPIHGAMILYTTIPGDKEPRVQINITDYSKLI